MGPGQLGGLLLNPLRFLMTFLSQGDNILDVSHQCQAEVVRTSLMVLLRPLERR